jgi:chromosome segregation ATPase
LRAEIVRVIAAGKDDIDEVEAKAIEAAKPAVYTPSIQERVRESAYRMTEEIENAIEILSAQLSELETNIDTIISIETAIAEHKEKIIELNTSIIGNQNYIKKLQEEMQNESSNTSNLEDEKTNLKTLAKEVVVLAEEKGKLTEDKHYHEIAGILLRDTGIKTKIIKQYLPVINKLVNKYLTANVTSICCVLNKSKKSIA